jgi:hypothetical protein
MFCNFVMLVQFGSRAAANGGSIPVREAGTERGAWPERVVSSSERVQAIPEPKTHHFRRVPDFGSRSMKGVAGARRRITHPFG